VGSGLLADEVGLGKTAQAACSLTTPAIVVCPAPLRVNWLRELKRWRPELKVEMISGRSASLAAALAADVIVVNYEVLESYSAALAARPTATLVVDEAHYAKSLVVRNRRDKATKTWKRTYSGSSRAKAIAKLAEVSERRILLTGTPTPNRPIELFPLLHLVDPKTWRSTATFGSRFCAGHLKTVARGKKVWDFSGSSNIEELHAKIDGTFMLRRLQQDVLSDLPAKSRRTLLVSLSEAYEKQYALAESDFLEWVKANGGPEAVEKSAKGEALAKMTALRHVAALGKVEFALNWIAQHQEGTKRPLIVMGHHRDVMESIFESLVSAGLRVGRISGGQSAEDKQKDIDAFQAGSLDVICCSILAAGVGLTLTAASETLFVERAWRPSDLVQAEGRNYRIGQTRPVTVTYLDAAGTIDEDMAKLLQEKVKTIAGVVDGLDLSTAQAEASVFGSMLESRRPDDRTLVRAKQLPLPVHSEW
jgi:SNF2 family DNA or RNA helicase